MSPFRNQPVSRRSAITGLLGTFALMRTGSVGTAQVDRPAPVDLGHGLEIRDYRLFPTEDVMRFIVEIHNTTDTAVDTPSVGVVLPHMDTGNFGWANPVSSVLHPHTSDCLIGVAPNAVTADHDWGTPDWLLCDSVQTKVAESIQEWLYEFTHSTEIVSDTHARTTVKVTNHNDTAASRLILQGLVRDSEGRMCGSLLSISLSGVNPGETDELIINLQSGHDFTANPFALIDTVAGVEKSFTVQPRTPALNTGCEAMMPWID